MFTEIHHALTAAIATGKIGTPVSVRVHLQLPETRADFDAAIDAIVATTKPALHETMQTLQSRVNAEGNQWNVLLRSANGRSLFVTLGRGSAREPRLELLVVGNHGVIRLEGGDVLYEAVGCDAAELAAQRSETDWAGIVERSHTEGARVSLL